MLPRLASAMTVALLAAACTPMQWVKEDATPKQLSDDSIECRQAAWREARSYDWNYYPPFGPAPFRDVFGQHVFAPGAFTMPFGDPYIEESRLAQFCMRNKGYRLEPLKKDGG